MNNIGYAKRDAFKLQLIKASESRQKVYENTINRVNTCPNARRIDNKFTIKDIFSNYWEEFCQLNSHKVIRPAILTNVKRMIACRDLSKGYVFYECPSCGEVYRERRVNEIAKKEDRELG